VSNETRRIWKYQLQVMGVQSIKTRVGAKILTVQVHNGVVCLWVEFDYRNEEETRTIEMFTTGEPMKESQRRYIGSVDVPDTLDFFCFKHVYERLEKHNVEV